MEKSFSDSYKAAGVDITAGYKAVELMKKHIARTTTSGAVSDIGGFGGLFAPDLSGMKNPRGSGEPEDRGGFASATDNYSPSAFQTGSRSTISPLQAAWSSASAKTALRSPSAPLHFGGTPRDIVS